MSKKKRKGKRPRRPERVTLAEQIRQSIAADAMGTAHASALGSGDSCLVRFYIPMLEPLGLETGFTFVLGEPPEDLADLDPRAYWPQGQVPTSDAAFLDVRFVTVSVDFWATQRASVAGRAAASADPISAWTDPLLGPAPDNDVNYPMTVAIVTQVVDGAALQTDQAGELGGALDESLKVIRAFQRAMILVAREPYTPLAREQLGLGIPMAVRRASRPHEAWEPSSLMLGQGMRTIIEREVDPSTVEMAIEVLVRGERAHPHYTFVQLRNDANLAFEDRGDYRLAVILTAVASETYLDTLLLMLLLEEGVESDSIKQLFSDKRLVKRSNEEYSSRLGGNWSSGGAVGAWRESVNAMRNRVMHGAVEPTEAHARNAVDSLERLEGFVLDRLASPQVRRKYPRTAVSFVGYSALVRRGVRSGEMRSMDPSNRQFADEYFELRDLVFANLTG